MAWLISLTVFFSKRQLQIDQTCREELKRILQQLQDKAKAGRIDKRGAKYKNVSGMKREELIAKIILHKKR